MVLRLETSCYFSRFIGTSCLNDIYTNPSKTNFILTDKIRQFACIGKVEDARNSITFPKLLAAFLSVQDPFMFEMHIDNDI